MLEGLTVPLEPLFPPAKTELTGLCILELLQGLKEITYCRPPCSRAAVLKLGCSWESPEGPGRTEGRPHPTVF